MPWLEKLAHKLFLPWFGGPNRNPPDEHEVSGYYRVNPETGQEEWVSPHARGGRDDR